MQALIIASVITNALALILIAASLIGGWMIRHREHAELRRYHARRESR